MGCCTQVGVVFECVLCVSRGVVLSGVQLFTTAL